jgi:uridylate kinase
MAVTAESRSNLNTRRVMLKLSGEILSGGGTEGPLHATGLELIANQIEGALSLGTQVAVVIGGGNIHRGARSLGRDYPRPASDAIGMVGTLVNALAIQAELRHRGRRASVLNSFAVDRVATLHTPQRARDLLDKGEVVIFAGGTGNPFFTTDTAAALRALESACTVLIKGTKVAGVYSADPNKDKNAKFYQSLSFEDVLRDKLEVMDLTAITLCMENNLPVVVLNALDEGSIKKFLDGDNLGTLILPQEG